MPGGVCAILDYEVEAMAEYVAEMTCRVVTPESVVTPGFRKFVNQILTSTRLPSTTILLGMNYLAKRMNAMKTQGSKFLDDNTFQNRSWSEVSGIAVSELNSLEFDWVQAMGWRLYVNLDLSKDYQAWLENWRDWQALKKRQAQVGRERLASVVPAIDTDLARYNGSRHSPHSRYLQEQVAEYERYQAMKAQQHNYRSSEESWPRNQWGAPLTPPDSGYGTPDYSMSTTSTNAHYNDWFAQAAAQYTTRYPQSATHNRYYSGRHHAPYASQYSYGQNVWEHGMADCNCSNCVGPLKHAPYFQSHGYGQPVMG